MEDKLKPFHLNKPSQVLLLLFMVASDHDWHGSKSVGLDGRHDASATVGHLFSDQATVLKRDGIKFPFSSGIFESSY